MRQSNITGIEVFKIEKCDDALRHAVGVDRIGAVVKVSDRPILSEEIGSVELETTTHTRFELGRFDTPSDSSQRGQVEPGVEVVNPSLMRSLTIVPTAVCMLLCG